MHESYINLLCSIPSYMNKWTFVWVNPSIKRLTECIYGTILSFNPWNIATGQVTSLTFAILSNLSSIMRLAKPPHILRAIDCTDLMGLISNKAWGLYFAARWHAGPEPIERPQTIIFYSSIINSLVQNWYTLSASWVIWSLIFFTPSFLF